MAKKSNPVKPASPKRKKAAPKKAAPKKAVTKPASPKGRKPIEKKVVKKAAVKKVKKAPVKPVSSKGKKAAPIKVVAKKSITKKIVNKASVKKVAVKKPVAKKVIAKKKTAPVLWPVQLPDATVENAANSNQQMLIPDNGLQEAPKKTEDPVKTFDKNVFNKATSKGDPHSNRHFSSKPKNTIKPSGKKPLW